jgi:hypothetical protein
MYVHTLLPDREDNPARPCKIAASMDPKLHGFACTFSLPQSALKADCQNEKLKGPGGQWQGTSRSKTTHYRTNKHGDYSLVKDNTKV